MFDFLILGGAESCQPAVVPVFVNAGAALLPAIIAGLVSVFSVLLNPKKFIHLCKTKPYVPILVVAGIAGLYFICSYFLSAPPEEEKKPQGLILAQGSGKTPQQWLEFAKELAKNENSGSVESSTSNDKILQEIEKLNRKIDALSQGGSKLPILKEDAGKATTQLQKSQNKTSKNKPAVQFRGNMERSGYLGGKAPTNLKLKWSHMDEGLMYWSAPVVSGDKVFAAWCYLDPPGSYGAVECFDKKSGKMLWAIETKKDESEFKGFFSSPSLSEDGKYLLIGQGLHPDYDSELVCIDTEKGQIKWLAKTPLHVESSPAVAGDIAVVGVGAVEDATTHKPKKHRDKEKDKNPGYVMAVQISTGKELWKTVVNDPESSPAIADGKVFIGSGFNGKAVVALDLKTGKKLWETPTPFPATGAVTVKDDFLLVGCGNGDYVFQALNPDGYVIALDKKDGKILWKQPMGDAVLGAVAVHGDVAIAPVRNGDIVALNLKAPSPKKREIWRQKVKPGSRALAGPAFDGKNVYAVSHDGYLVVMDAKNGKIKEKHYLNSTPGEMGMSLSSPIIVDGKLFVGSETGGIRCYTGGEGK